MSFAFAKPAARRPRRGRRPCTRLWLLALEGRISPANLVVTSAADSGPGSLRATLTTAATNNEADTITFDSSVSTIDLVTGQLSVYVNEKNSLTIDGGGTVTIQGAATVGPTNRLFNIGSAYSKQFPSVTIRNITLANGNVTGSGGALFLDPLVRIPVTLENCTFTGNKASENGGAALLADASVSISGCAFIDNSARYGGAIYNYASTVSVKSSELSKNSATHEGGGIFSYYGALNVDSTLVAGNTADPAGLQHGGGGGLALWGIQVSVSNCRVIGNSGSSGGGVKAAFAPTIVGCEVTGNTAAFVGGGIYLRDSASVIGCTIAGNAAGQAGGGVYIWDSATFRNCTVADNDAGTTGGGFYVYESLTISNSTVADNTAVVRAGGIDLSSTDSVQIDSTVVAANVAPVNPDMSGSTYKTKIDGGSNLFGSHDPARFVLTGSNDPTLIGTETNPVWPGLLPLDDYGGSLPTMPPGFTSLAVNRGSNPAGLATDQRGLPRESPLGQPDIGAAEGSAPLPFVVDVGPLLTVTAAGATSYFVTVTYDSPAGIDTATLDGSDLTITASQVLPAIALVASQVAGTRVTATYLVTPPGGDWDLRDNGMYSVRITDGQVLDLANPANSVGAQLVGTFRVATAGAVTVDSPTDVVDGNHGLGQLSFREALLLANGMPSADTIAFDPNMVGPGVTITLTGEMSISAPVTITGPGMDRLTVSGGKIGRILTLKRASNYQVYDVTLAGLTLANGSAKGHGGAILNDGAKLTLSDCAISHNTATSGGGGIAVATNGAALTISRSRLTSNTAANGGAIHVSDYSSTVVNVLASTLAGNKALGNGGAINAAHGLITLSGTTISGNTASNGGGIFGRPLIDNCTLCDNKASTAGGAIYQSDRPGTMIVRNSTVTANWAGIRGGGVSRGPNASAVELSSMVAAGNAAPDGPDLWSAVSIAIAGSGNLIGVADTSNITFTHPGNLLGILVSPLNPELGPLADNGGPTLTRLPLPGSPTIDRGNNSAKLSEDQRGLKRTSGPGTDIGAVEAVSPVPAAAVGQFADVTPATPGPYFLTVFFNDEVGQIDVSTVKTGNLTVVGPNGFSAQPALVRLTGGNARVTAIYQLNPPINAAPGWDSSDNGTYTVSLNGASVFDLDAPNPNAVPGRDLGTISVQFAVNLVVNALNDELTDTDGKLSLREALSMANSDSTTLDTIVFDPVAFATPQRIAVAEAGLGDLVISGPTRLIGPGSERLSVAANVSQNVLTITGGLVTVSGLAITGGAWGITATGGDITLDRLLVTANGSLTFGGGGISVRSYTGSVTIRDSSVIDNAGGDGAGANISTANVRVTNCTFAGNTSTGKGGGLNLFGGNAHLVNTTVTQNAAAIGGGAYLYLTPSIGYEKLVEGCVFADNLATNGPDVAGYYGSTPLMNSFVGRVDGSFSFSDLGGNIIGSIAQPVDARLGAIGVDGSPLPVVGLLPGSPLIDKAGNSAIVAFDQRGPGFWRTEGQQADVGSYEGVSALPAARWVPVGTIFNPGPTPNTVTVTYRDGSGINLASIGPTDITVRGPAGRLATVEKATATQFGDSTVVTYTIVPPGGSWDGGDAGDYAVSVSAGEVSDLDAVTHAVPGAVLGRFRVSLNAAFLVDEPTDVDDGDQSLGKLSLREALDRVNADPLTTDTITFEPSAFPAGTVLTNRRSVNTWYRIASPVACMGPGANRLVLDGNQLARVLAISVPGATLTPVFLSGITFQKGNEQVDGRGGGGILISDESVTLAGVVVSGNKAWNNGGGIAVSDGAAVVTIRDSHIRDNTIGASSYSNAGGIFVHGSVFVAGTRLVLERSTVTGNSARFGAGGIMVGERGILQVSDCLIANNRVTADGYGGGVLLSGTIGAESVIRNTTISGNSAASSYSRGGGIALYNCKGVLPIENSTISNNSASHGGGIARFHGTGVFSLTGSVVSGNLGKIGRDLSAYPPAVVEGKNNLVGVANDASITLSSAVNLTGTLTSPLNAKLAALANYGGPTRTHALLPGSPAIDAGANPAGLVYDQRGPNFYRASGAAADIGAYEVQRPPRVVGVTINSGEAQRSRVTSIRIDFDTPVNLPIDPADAFELIRQSDNAGVALAAAVTTGVSTSVTLTFPGTLSEFGSLADGRYTLTVITAAVSNANGWLDGNGDGVTGDDFVLAGTPANGLFRLFGDADGDGDVDAGDFQTYRTAFGSPSLAFDFDNDGDTDALDFAQFRRRFGASI